ncbi:MAG: hypothetical protein CR981_03750 [Proteobacteria bacterium]|nr:MAG: hypothetical protein CR981_03750 [Pseudomonadota bacterium]
MNRIFFSIMLIFFFLPPAQAAETGMDSCNIFYHEGQFEAAIDCYRNVTDHHSAAVYYNMANSYAQLGQTGYSVLYYQRALCLSPHDSDISGNLSLIRKETGLFSPEPTLSQFVTGLLTTGQWSVLALSGLVLYVIFLFFLLRGKGHGPVEMVITICSLLIIILGSAGAWIQYLGQDRSVVIEDSGLLLSPFATASTSGTLKQGRLVRVDKQHEQFSYITDETGRKGWIATEKIVPVIPEKARPQ